MAEKVRHILGLSGGKDSAALAVYLRDKVPDMEYFFADTHKELPETYEFLDLLEARLGITVHRLSADRGFDHFLDINNGFLPSAKQRWCTLEMKIKPMEQFVGDDTAISYVAIRADENRLGYKAKHEKNITPVFPFKEDGIDINGVYRLLEDAGIGLPKYYDWRSRSGCYFCFFQRKIEWVGLYENHPDLFAKAQEYESGHSDGRRYTWNEGESLAELIERKDRIKEQYHKRQEQHKQKRSSMTLVDAFPSAELEDDEDDCAICAL